MRLAKRPQRRQVAALVTVLVTVFVALTTLLPLAGCEQKARRPDAPHRPGALILGVDALDWQVLEPLLEAGRAPVLARLRAEGASGVCLSFLPLEKSPLIWASIATGLKPAEHGVGGFVKQRGDSYDVLTSAADWRAPAVWDIAGATERSNCVIGWWVTFPARPIAGVMVSDHLSYTAAGPRNAEGLVRPDSLRDELAALTIGFRDVPDSLLQRLAPGASPEIIADVTGPLHRLRAALAGDLTYLATARRLLADRRWDFATVYFRGLDLVCHYYWQYYHPGDGPEQTEEDRARYGSIVPNYYELIDGWLGELLALVDDDTNVVVVSDHGFYGPRRDRAGNTVRGVGEHRAEGAIIIRSPLYRPGTRLTDAHVMDVAPTTLALLGLPPSREMSGRILAEGLTDAAARFVTYLDANRIASYAALAPVPPPEVADDPAVDEAIRRQLRSLGYVD